MSFAKLFSTITESSLWGQSKDARLLFVSMLARADQNGFVEAAVTGLARMSNLTLAETQAALAELEAPDPYSKSPENEGRRVMKCDRGWRLTNYDAYRNRRDDEARREYKAKWIRDRRAQSRRHPVDNVDSGGQECTQAEAEAEAEADYSAAAPPRSAVTTTAATNPMDQAMEGMRPAPQAPLRLNFADWRIQVGHRIFVGQDERREWEALFAAEGWDSMSAGYTILDRKHPKPAKLFLSMFQEIRK